MNKGRPTQARDKRWHDRHLKRIKRREEIRRAHIQNFNLKVAAEKKQPEIIYKPIERTFWQKIKLFFKRLWNKVTIN